ncbi:DUF333 domain-containing protein [Methylobacterium sp. NEAU 140]|uniref:putative hemolysin n=1 Tax=Methylobacterium sp. NEAU 140 TaxID=3064945 RepID=UPI0027339F39|nr:DUF333 domain-containing protein [Methylobacterium sp. NEAU 140]MDP4023564.1 DUF333 domain-containing protein [Methylobacterium sp. NEAU 140]
MRVRSLLAAFGLCLNVGVCGAGQPGAPGGPSGLANPAAVNCVARGGATEIRNGKGGQIGYCRFADGRVCEEWALLRGDRCAPPK